MRCLYCGKELALLKRLRGGGEFCSEAHKQRYQEEYDKIALSRLLQAQKKGPNSTAESTASPTLSKSEVIEESSSPAARDRQPEPIASAVKATVQETVPETPSEEIEAPAEAAGFLVEQPAPADASTEIMSEPDMDLWTEPVPDPAVPAFAFEPGSPSVPSAGLVSFQPDANAADTEPDLSLPEATIDDLRFGEDQAGPALPPARSTAIPTSNLLPVAGTTSVEVPIRGQKVLAREIGALSFRLEIGFGESPLWSREATAPEYPAEDSDWSTALTRTDSRSSDASSATLSWEADGAVAVLEQVEDSGSPNTLTATAPIEKEEPATPHATLEALRRLHELTQTEPEPPAPAALAGPAAPAAPAAPVSAVAASADPAPENDIAAEDDTIPRRASHLLELAVKIATPPKRVARNLSALSFAGPPLVPRLKTLPLRPKIAPMPLTAVPEAKTASAPPMNVPKTQLPANGDSKGKVVSKSEPASSKPKPESVLSTPSKVTNTSKPVPGAGKPVPQAKTKEKPVATTAKTTPAKTSSPTNTAKPTAASPAEPSPKPPLPRPQGESSDKPETNSAVGSVPASDDALPSFGAIGKSGSFGASVKVKVGIAVLLIAVGCAAYFTLGAKSSKSSVSATATPGDGAGPSIILGEGGWVVGWGGDSSTARSGREITIYRPSLKLSNYRIEFQGDIETNSMGWVFRAADPDNYYAMKLTNVSTGVSPKVALFKYIVIKGRQTQVGRVPIDTAVRNDTVFKVRVDVRGAKISTFVQGQPVDVWTDDQLKTGGVGFLNERGERGRIKSVSIRYLNGDDN